MKRQVTRQERKESKVDSRATSVEKEKIYFSFYGTKRCLVFKTHLAIFFFIENKITTEEGDHVLAKSPPSHPVNKSEL